MIILTIILFVIVAVTITLNAAQLVLVVYLWRQRKRALAAVQILNNNVYSLLVERATKQQEAKPTLHWYKESDTIH